IQNSNVQQFWTDITRREEDGISSSNGNFMLEQREIIIQRTQEN
ncbi:25264_t:CDS:2, partial [Gigaspora rosea]